MFLFRDSLSYSLHYCIVDTACKYCGQEEQPISYYPQELATNPTEGNSEQAGTSSSLEEEEELHIVEGYPEECDPKEGNLEEDNLEKDFPVEVVHRGMGFRQEHLHTKRAPSVKSIVGELLG